MAKKVIGYIRVSTDEQISGYGLDAQRQSIMSYCNAYGYEMIDLVADEGKSGSNQDREGLQDVLTRIERNEAEGVVVYKLDRLSRKLRDFIDIHDRLESWNASIISVQEQFDTSTPIGRLFFQLLGGFAEFERDLITERMMAGKKAKARKGMFAGGSAPYGYEIKNGDLVINEVESRYVQLVFRLKRQGNSLQMIADNLNQREAPTRRGGTWARAHVKSILDREAFYRGSYKYSDVIAKGQHDPIINGGI